VIWLAEFAVALGAVGFGGTARPWVVAVVVTPVDTSGVALAFRAQIRKAYWVSWVKPVTAWLKPVTPVIWALEQFAGAVAPTA
jgi:hypothetical protein